jgi:hypothetical protein
MGENLKTIDLDLDHEQNERNPLTKINRIAFKSIYFLLESELEIDHGFYLLHLTTVVHEQFHAFFLIIQKLR